MFNIVVKSIEMIIEGILKLSELRAKLTKPKRDILCNLLFNVYLTIEMVHDVSLDVLHHFSSIDNDAALSRIHDRLLEMARLIANFDAYLWELNDYLKLVDSHLSEYFHDVFGFKCLLLALMRDYYEYYSGRNAQGIMQPLRDLEEISVGKIARLETPLLGFVDSPDHSRPYFDVRGPLPNGLSVLTNVNFDRLPCYGYDTLHEICMHEGFHRFTISRSAIHALREGAVPSQLRKIFEDRKVSLSSEAHIVNVGDNHWEVNDGNTYYKVRVTEKHLVFYDITNIKERIGKKLKYLEAAKANDSIVDTQLKVNDREGIELLIAEGKQNIKRLLELKERLKHFMLTSFDMHDFFFPRKSKRGFLFWRSKR